MALPAGYHESTFMDKYGGVPTDYQLDGYLVQVAASTAQKAVVASTRTNQRGTVLSPSKVSDILKGNA